MPESSCSTQDEMRRLQSAHARFLQDTFRFLQADATSIPDDHPCAGNSGIVILRVIRLLRVARSIKLVRYFKDLYLLVGEKNQNLTKFDTKY